MTDLYDLSPLLRLMLLGSAIALGPLAWCGGAAVGPVRGGACGAHSAYALSDV